MPQETVDRAPREGVQGGSKEQPAEVQSLFGRLWAVVVKDAFVNLTVVAALGIGFFHGWLKLRYRSPVTTFAYDIVLIVALVVVFLRSGGSLKQFFPPGRTSNALIAFYGLCLAYLPFSLIPGMPPFLVALSTLRGWIFGTFLYGLGYQIIRNRSQMHGYFLVILFLGVVTAIYGIQQSDAEVLQMMKDDPYFARRYRGQGYLDSEGDFHVRRFSTFISSGAFGATMATTIVFGSALLLAPTTRFLERAVIGVSMVPIGYGMVLSGARSATITAVVGCVALLAFRRKLLAGVVILGIIALGAVLASQATGGGVLDRLSTLNFKNIFYRFWWPTYLGLDFMSTNPLGGGLGKTGFSPAFLRGANEYTDYLAPDGDLGRLMVEFGILGVILFGRLSWCAAKRMYEAVRATQHTLSGSLVLAAAVNLWISIAFVGVGSPFIGIPMGVLVWFFVGAAERLQEIEATQSAGTNRISEPFAPVGSQRPPLAQASGMSFAPKTPSNRRFLFATKDARPASVAAPPPEPGPVQVPEAAIPPAASGSPDPIAPLAPLASDPKTRASSGKVFLYGAGKKRTPRAQPAIRSKRPKPGSPRSPGK